eukprot:313528_1
MPSELGIAFSAIGCLFATILIILCECHSAIHYIQSKSEIAKPQKKLMCMELIMIVLFLLTTLCDVCLRHNYFATSYQSEEDFTSTQCRVAMLEMLPYLSGKIILYGSFMYRVHKTFENTALRIRKTIPYVLLCVLSLIAITFIVCVVTTVMSQSHDVVIYRAGDILFCDLQYNHRAASMAFLLLVLPITNMFAGLFVCIYLIYLFSSRLNALRAQIEMQNNIFGSQSQVDSVTNETTNPMAKDEAMKLKSLTVKQAVLGISALVSSLFFYVYGMTTRSAGFIGWDIMINTFSVHFMFSYSRRLCGSNPK